LQHLKIQSMYVDITVDKAEIMMALHLEANV